MSRMEVNQSTAKASLTQMLNVVFQRMEAGSEQVTRGSCVRPSQLGKYFDPKIFANCGRCSLTCLQGAAGTCRSWKAVAEDYRHSCRHMQTSGHDILH